MSLQMIEWGRERERGGGGKEGGEGLTGFSKILTFRHSASSE